MKLPVFQVDAFAEKLFQGNPAAVVPLKKWLPEEVMQSIAAENNLSETAFFIEEDNGFHIRWFTPTTEVELCGHATLATAHILYEEMNYKAQIIRLNSRSGTLVVTRENNLLHLNFPSDPVKEITPEEKLIKALGKTPIKAYKGRTDYLLIYSSEKEIIDLLPDHRSLKYLGVRGVIVSSQGNEVDFISRFFAPGSGIDEDPVTGSAHTTLIPYWSKQLNKSDMTAIQRSKRGGKIWCKYLNERVLIGGKAVTFMKGELSV